MKEQHALTISIVEAGRRLGVGKDASYLAANRGELPVIVIGGRRRVPLAATATSPTPKYPKTVTATTQTK